MKQVRARSTFSLFLCVGLGIHNRKWISRTGAVHYCSRCGIVTSDDRRQGMSLDSTSGYYPGMKIIFGHPGQEYLGTVESVDHQDGKVRISRIRIVPKWRTLLSKVRVSVRSLFTRKKT